jgi:hypothetical protein
MFTPDEPFSHAEIHGATGILCRATCSGVTEGPIW